MREQPEKIDAKFVKGFIRRRKKIFVVVSSILIIASIIYGLYQPKVYVSTATILIEGQIASEILKGISMGFVEERLSVITQQIMTRDKLTQIIRKLNLHPDLETPQSIDSAVEIMRKNIELKTIKAGDIDPRSYGPITTVAFKLSYSSEDPSTAYKVVKELTALYVEKNLQRREQITAQATAVLKEKLGQLKEQRDAIDAKLNSFKRAHSGELPENMAFNIEQIYRLNAQLDEVNAKIKNLEDIKAGSPGLQTPPVMMSGTTSPVEPAAADSWARLAQLRAQLLSLQSRYSDKHPDVRKTKGEIQRLETQLGVSESAKERELDDLRNRLASLKKSTGPDDPEVKKLSDEISVLSRQVEEQKRSMRQTGKASVDNELSRQIKKRDELQIRINEFTRKSQASSMVQKEYGNLLQEYENTSKQYNDTVGKLTDAKIAKEIEDTQLGERFTVIEEPQVPFQPQKPNRLKILLGGFFLALCGGLFASIFAENLDHTIKSAEQLQKITKVPVLTVLPFVMTDEERNARSSKRGIAKIFEDVKREASNWVRRAKAKNAQK